MSLTIQTSKRVPVQSTLLDTPQQHIRSVEVVQHERFKPDLTENAEETVVILKGTGRIKIGSETQQIAPNTLVKMTSDKVVKIYSDQAEPLSLFWIKATVALGQKAPESEGMYIRKKADCYEIKATEQERIYELFGKTNGDAQMHSVALVDIYEGGSSARHYHPIVNETYLITEGKGRLVIDEKESFVKAGDVIAIPVGLNHQIFNIAKEVLRLTVVVTPPWTMDCGVYN